jgi:hypothetical protein
MKHQILSWASSPLFPGSRNPSLEADKSQLCRLYAGVIGCVFLVLKVDVKDIGIVIVTPNL